MSSQLIAFGYIEIPTGSEQDNANRLTSLGKLRQLPEFDLLSAMSDAQSGWPTSMISFARSFKKIEDTQHTILRNEFESILQALDASSAELNIDDEEGQISCRLCYAFGPRKFGEPDSWSCVSRK